MPAAIWNKPIADVEAPKLLAALGAVRALDDESARVPETLRRVLQRLDSVFEDAMFHKRCASNPAAALRRKLRETMPRKEAGHFAALPYRNAPPFMARLREAQGTTARCLALNGPHCLKPKVELTSARCRATRCGNWHQAHPSCGL